MFGIKKAITCVALAMMSMAPIAAAEDMVAMLPVSDTHLTLPTIYSV